MRYDYGKFLRELKNTLHLIAQWNMYFSLLHNPCFVRVLWMEQTTQRY